MDSSLVDRVACNPATLISFFQIGNSTAMEQGLKGEASNQGLTEYLIGTMRAIEAWRRGTLVYTLPTYLMHVLSIIENLPKDSPLREPLSSMPARGNA